MAGPEMISNDPPLSASLELRQPDSLDMLRPAPEDGFPGAGTEEDRATERRLLVFRKIAAPLLAAVTGWSHTGDQAGATPSRHASQLSELIASTVHLNQHVATIFGLDAAGGNARWLSASGVAEIVAAHYRVSTSAMSDAEGFAVIGALKNAVEEGMAGLSPPPIEAEEQASTLGRSLKALAPAASAIARFSFGRDPMELLADVSRRLTSIAGEITGKLSPMDVPDDALGSPLYFAVLEVAGEFYKESHFTEMDRLLEMPPEERKEYVVAHGRRIPMEPVWERLGLRLGMLEALAGYLPRPGAAAPGAAAQGAAAQGKIAPGEAQEAESEGFT